MRAKTTFIQKYNNRLKTLHQNIRIRQWSDTILLSNNVEIIAQNEIYNFLNLCKSSSIMAKHIDDIYAEPNRIIERRYYWRKQMCSEGGKKAQRQSGTKIRKNLAQKGNVPWNKGQITGIVPWNKGLTKHDDPRIQQLSILRRGKDNPSYGRKLSESEKRAKSKLMKDRIRRGEFTPCVHNSLSRWKYAFGDKKYRSAWEVMFQALHPTAKYEKLRIPYRYKDEEKIYIVDFIDEERRVCYEIKPSSQHHTEKNQCKERSLRIWSEKNNFSYKIIDEDYFSSNYQTLRCMHLEEKVLNSLEMLNETCKKNRN